MIPMKKPVNRVKRKENLAGWAFIAPTMIAFLILTALPFFIALFLSFAQVSYFKGWDTLKIVGFQNFIDIFQDKKFVTSLGNTFVYVVTIVPLSIILSLVFAYCMNGRIYGKKFLRMAFFIPYISSIVAVGTVFKFLFREDGIINNILLNLHILSQPIKWAMDPRFSKVPIILLSVWASIGYQLILFTAAMQNVPVSLYEAAKLDGANEARIFFQIVIPMSRPILVYTIINSFLTPWTDFVVAKMILNSGVSADWTVAIGLYNMLQKALINNYFSRFCAGGVLVAIPISVLFVIMQKFYVEGITSGAAKG